MSDPDGISRRNWLRGKFTSEKVEPAQPNSLGLCAHPTRPVQQESPPPGSETWQLGDAESARTEQAGPGAPTDLPAVHEAMISVEEVAAIFADIERFGTSIDVVDRGGGNLSRGALTPALESFRERRSRAIQVRYLWDGQRWIDTFTRTAEGARLVRVAHAAG